MSAQCPPPRWRSARHDPHKGAGLGGPFFAGGFRNADQLSGHLSLTTRSSARPAGFRAGACSSTGRLRHGFIISPVPQKRPDSAGHLRGKGDDSDVGMGAHKQRTQPGAYGRIRLCVCAVSAPLILRIPGLGGLCHLSVEADGEAIWQMVEKVLSVSARLLSLGAGTGGGQRR